MRGMLMRLAVVVLAFGPIAASGVNAPSVIMATPGNGDGAERSWV